MLKKMTKKQALEEFREFMMPLIKKQEKEWSGKARVDEAFRREEWNNFTDALCKNGRITKHQYESWDNPF